MGLSVGGIVALLQQKGTGKVRGQISDLVVAHCVDVFGIGKRLACGLHGLILLPVIKAAAQKLHHGFQVCHGNASFLSGTIRTVPPAAAGTPAGPGGPPFRGVPILPGPRKKVNRAGTSACPVEGNRSSAERHFIFGA